MTTEARPGTTLTSQEARLLAEEHGLRQLGVRPPLRDYLSQLWQRRAFIRVLAYSKSYAKHQNSYLGALWSVINPVLNAVMYAAIFGLILRTDRGTVNVVGFIVVGIFMFRFVDRSVMVGAKSISSNTTLMRSMHFPRAVLPISAVMAELTTLLPAIGVMYVATWAAGYIPWLGDIPVTWSWLLIPFVVVIMSVFNTGLAFITARIVAAVPDLQNILSFIMRFVMYGSGVIFSITHYATGWVAEVLHYQPVAVYLYLARSSLLDEPEFPPDPWMWLWAVLWAVVTLVIGFFVFFRAEERYGRD